MNSKNKRKKVSKPPLNEFQIIDPNAAGIDVSSKDHVVSVPKDRAKEHMSTFGAFTCDLHEIAKWLLSCRMETVAMESTPFLLESAFSGASGVWIRRFSSQRSSPQACKA